MGGLTILFFFLAIGATVLGYGGLAGSLAYLAKWCAVLFVIMLIASALYTLVTGKKPPVV